MSVQMAGQMETGARQPQMSQEIEQLGNTADIITEVVDQLNQRLSPVMRQEPSAVETDKIKELDALTPHADKIRNSRIRLDQVHTKLLDIQRKLEV